MQIEQVVDSGVVFQKPLSMLYRFEASHTPFSDTGGLVGEFRTIIGILIGVVIGFRDQ